MNKEFEEFSKNKLDKKEPEICKSLCLIKITELLFEIRDYLSAKHK